MTQARTTIESIASKPHVLRAPLLGTLAPGAYVHSTASIAAIAAAYECSLAAIQGIAVQGAARVRLPIVVRSAAPGVEATAGVDAIQVLAPLAAAMVESALAAPMLDAPVPVARPAIPPPANVPSVPAPVPSAPAAPSAPAPAVPGARVPRRPR